MNIGKENGDSNRTYFANSNATNCGKCLNSFMMILKLDLPEKSVKTMIDLVEQLGGRIIAIDDKKPKKVLKKKQILDDLEESMKFVKLHQEGKVEAKTPDQLMDEL
jgi:acetate kinase